MEQNIGRKSENLLKKSDKPKSWNIISYIVVGFFSFVFGYFIHFIDSSFIFSKENAELTAQGSLPKGFDSETFTEVWNYVKENYVDAEKVTDEKLFFGALEGVVGSARDPYSVYLEPVTSEQFQEEISGLFQGIGAEIGIRNSELTVISPLPGSPAEKAGLKGGDIIFKIDGKETKDMPLMTAVNLIRGKEGTRVILTIFRVDSAKEKEVTVTREKIQIKSIEWKMIGGVAYMKYKYFNEDTLSEFVSATNEIILKNPSGFILDLRNNPGGLLRTAIETSSYWIGGDEIVVIEKKRDGTFIAEKASNGKAIFRGIPTVVLINRGSASGSEILAGALQDYKLATLVGERTFGKGSVQDLRLLNDRSSVKLTIAKWLTPKGREIDEKGIDPDIKVELTEEDWNNGKDPQLEKAIEVLKEIK